MPTELPIIAIRRDGRVDGQSTAAPLEPLPVVEMPDDGKVVRLDPYRDRDDSQARTEPDESPEFGSSYRFSPKKLAQSPAFCVSCFLKDRR